MEVMPFSVYLSALISAAAAFAGIYAVEYFSDSFSWNSVIVATLFFGVIGLISSAYESLSERIEEIENKR